MILFSDSRRGGDPGGGVEPARAEICELNSDQLVKKIVSVETAANDEELLSVLLCAHGRSL